MKATIRWVEEARFEGESGTGHKATIDGPESIGGHNAGMRPMEMVLMGTAACSSVDVISILKKSRQHVSNCIAEVEAIRVDTVPAVFESIHLHFKVSGENLSEKHVERAVALSAEKYCSASIMLAKGGVDISHSFEIVE